jgi:hypothetical protein
MTATYHQCQILQWKKRQYARQFIIVQSRDGAWVIAVCGVDGGSVAIDRTQLPMRRLLQ